MPNLDGSPPVTPMFIAVVDGMVATVRGHMIVDRAEAFDGMGWQLVRVPASTQGVRFTATYTASKADPKWWEQEDAR